MAYVKTVWETGDVITAEKLNNMEGGIEKATPYEIPVSSVNPLTLALTWQEIKDLFDAGKILYIASLPQFIVSVTSEGGYYGVGVFRPYMQDGHLELISGLETDSADGYPTA